MSRFETLEEYARRRDWVGVEREAHRLRNEYMADLMKRTWSRMSGWLSPRRLRA